ncbi:NADP-dependent oxidoreductase domain-containing protein [Gilbertella persicaria]|uniref:NADP-dependent oxidoreductase domain-containing protein n=1 Tax=Gilbertella persicaria TaxID=101096 RepID=UPI00221ED8F5|nr:NADP-dependent oxidoreductase domain-containing protein [Gilbertella persicaria]KAI8080159.1 NADP-dependent oxidoreductase domain-containing protein [Gilbertella persicaria]
MSFRQNFKLNTGVLMPAIGLGTWRSKPEEVYHAVKTAIEAGYHANEKEVGQAIKDSGVPREELFITTKLWNTFHRPELVQVALKRSLDNLQLDYLDLYLMHWPVSFQPSDVKQPRDENGHILLDDTDFTVTYAEMEKLVKSNQVRAIGVSNFSIENLEKLAKTATIYPAVNQIEVHPLLPQQELIDYCLSHGIVVTAYSPLGSSDSLIMKNQTILDMANRHHATTAQVLIAWGIQRGYGVLPKSVTPLRIISNLQRIELSTQDMDEINRLIKDQSQQRLGDPFYSWDVDVFGLHIGEEKKK